MNKTLLIPVLVLFSLAAQAQIPIQRMWQMKDYEGLYEQRHRADRMGGPDILRVAQAAHHLGHDNTALNLVDIAVNKGYGSDQLLFLKGIILTEQQQYLPATKAFRQALVYRPNRLPYMMEMAAAYYKANALDSALAVYERTHRLFPEKDVPTTMVCHIHFEEGRMQKAEDCWLRSLDKIQAPEYLEEGLEQLARIQWDGTKNREGAERTMGWLIHRFPEPVRHRLMIIRFLGEEERWADMKPHLDHVREVHAGGNIAEEFTRNNAFPLVDVPAEEYRLQVFETLDPRRADHVIWKGFLVTEAQSRPVAKWSYSEYRGLRLLTSEGNWETVDTLDIALDVQGFVEKVRLRLITPIEPDPAPADTLQQDTVQRDTLSRARTQRRAEPIEQAPVEERRREETTAPDSTQSEAIRRLRQLREGR